MHGQGNSSARILDAALQLFSKKGYEATSTREICELAGITKPTLYYFFESKEGVYRALVELALKEYATVSETAICTPGGLRDKLKRFAELLFERTPIQRELARFLFSLLYSVNSPFAQLIQTSHENVVARMHEVVSNAATAGEISKGDVYVRITVFAGALMEAISNYLITDNPPLTRELAHSIVDTVFEGWGTSK